MRSTEIEQHSLPGEATRETRGKRAKDIMSKLHWRGSGTSTYATGSTAASLTQKPQNRKRDESGTGRDKSGKSRDESAKGWDESAARGC